MDPHQSKRSSHRAELVAVMSLFTELAENSPHQQRKATKRQKKTRRELSNCSFRRLAAIQQLNLGFRRRRTPLVLTPFVPTPFVPAPFVPAPFVPGPRPGPFIFSKVRSVQIQVNSPTTVVLQSHTLTKRSLIYRQDARRRD